MDKETIQEKTTSRLFFGFLINSELRMHLNSSGWDQIKSSIEKNSVPLIEVNYKGKDYIGQYLQEVKLPFNSIANFERELIEKLQNLCPKLDCSQRKCSIFTQIFIG